MSDRPAAISSHESYLTLAEASKLLPPIHGRRIHVSTLWRWCHKGRYGITLEYACMGRRMVTTYEAIQRFFIALAKHDISQCESSYPSVRRKTMRCTPAQRQRAMDEANAILVRAKIIPAARREPAPP